MALKKRKCLKRFLIWRLRHISDRNFIMMVSALIGVISGIVALAIKNAVHLIQHLIHRGIPENYHHYLYVALPIIGITLSVLFIKYVLRQRVGHGIPALLYAISKDNARLKPHNMFSSIVTSAFTVGFGGSVGLEGPTVATGSAFGANLGRLLHLNYKQRVLLLGCAASGAMAAIFKAPIAAIVFALEVIMLDLTMASLVPILIASTIAALTSYLLMGMDVIYPLQSVSVFQLDHIHWYTLLGITAAFFSIYFTRVYTYITQIFDKITNYWRKLVFGGLSLGLLLFFMPPLFGEGYDTTNAALSGDYSYVSDIFMLSDSGNSGWLAIGGLLLLILFKIVATSITFGSGGVGGIFAPTLFMGANIGLIFALTINALGFENISPAAFAMVGMGGMIAGVLHAPLTAIFLIADLTSGYSMFMPLMITATISYAIVKYFSPNSVYTMQLARRGQLMTHHADSNALKMMRIDRLIETNFKIVRPDNTLGQLVEIVAQSTRNVFPVVDKDNNFLGLITLDEIRQIMFKPDEYDKVYVHELMFQPIVTINIDETMEEVAQKIQSSGRFNVVVLDKGKYRGFVSRANVFSSYRRLLKKISEH